MKEKAKGILHSYLLVILAFLPSVFLIRLAEYLSLQFLHAVPDNTWLMVLSGYLLDNLGFLSFSLILLVPFFIISLLSKRTGMVLLFILLLFYTLISLTLVKYFMTTLVPLDQVIFFYTSHELVNIVLSSTRIDIATILAFIIILPAPLVFFFLIRKRRLNQIFLYFLLVILFISPVLMKYTLPKQENYRNDFEYYVKCCKPVYLLIKTTNYMSEKKTPAKTGDSFSSVVKRFHSNNPQFSYISQDYPLLRVDATPDVLGSYFSFKKEKPNLVFIIVESLSTSYCGNHAYYGSYMPFLDSLMGKSLYWSNFLSSAERTFHVLPAVFGSLPYCNNIFSTGTAPPLHFSLIRYLKENGYQSDFFYGGDPGFGGYDKFLTRERIDYILRYFGKEYGNDVIREKKFEWGYPDGDLFKRSFEAIDSLNSSSSRLDIYLTLSTHAPFTPPNEDHYRQKFRERFKKLVLSPDIRRMVDVQQNIFTSVIYTDDALRTFFNDYRKRKEFSNTIFIITGDHAMPELNYTYLNLLERYHVPLIIYSPMLKKPVHFESVSSHLDIAPSVLAMLKNAGFISTREQCHWTGKGIDVTEKFRNTHEMTFIFNDGVQAEYLENQYYYTCGRLYLLQPGLDLKFLKDSSLAQNMKGQLDDYLAITKNIISRNQLIPEDLFFSGSYTKSSYLAAKPAVYNRATTHDTYITVAPAHKIGDNYQFIKLDLSMVMEAKPGDSLKLPVLIIQVLNDKIENVAWYQLNFQPVDSTGKIKRFGISKYLDFSNVSDLRSKTMKLYLYKEDKNEILLDGMKLEMTGFKENKNFKTN